MAYILQYALCLSFPNKNLFVFVWWIYLKAHILLYNCPIFFFRATYFQTYQKPSLMKKNEANTKKKKNHFIHISRTELTLLLTTTDQ